MKQKHLFTCILVAVFLIPVAKAQRPYFDKSKDILIAQFDSKPDPDDIHSQAALGCMLVHPDLSGVNYYAVAGAVGTQNGDFIDSDALFNMAFGSGNWTDADANWNASVTNITNKVIPILQNGGKVWVQEAGQSNITADWIAQVLQTVAASTVKNNVVVVQHSEWNQNQTASADLTYVKNNATYYYIDDGNAPYGETSWGDHGEWSTPEYRNKDSQWIASAKSSQNPTAAQLWTEADRVIDTKWPDGYPEDWSYIHFDGVDYSDCSENWWIFNIGSDADSHAKFWSRYVTNSVSNVAVTGVSVSPTSATIEVGETVNLSETILPSNATNKNVSWSSSNNNIATVSNGLVTGVGVGSAAITVTTQDGGFTASASINVTPSTGTTHNLRAIQDAYLQGSTRFNTADLRVEAGNRVSYLMFDLSTINGNITSASLKLSVSSDAGSGVINIATGNSNNWTEANLSTSNAPSSSGQIGTLNTTYSAGQTYTWTLNASSISGGGMLSLIVTQGSGNDVSYGSDENSNAALRPVLTLRESATGGNIDVTGVSVSPTSATLTSAGATQNLIATVSPSDATNKNVSWSSSNTSAATVSTSGVVTAVANGATTITVTTDDGGFTAISAITVDITNNNVQTPYGGSNRTIPGTIEVEDFDNGGQGVAYNDADASNNGGAYRPNEGVDIETRDGGNTVGWTSNGEWLEYTVNTSSGTYDIEMRLAAISSGKVVNVLLDGTEIASFNVPNTGSWATFQTVAVSNIAVSAGTNRILRVEFEGGATNINWVKFENSGSVDTPVTGVSVSPTSTTLTSAGATQNLTATVSPSNATNKNVSWSSSNTSAATVNASGVVTAVANGNATITVTTDDGGFTATSAVTVEIPTNNNQTPYGGTNRTVPGTIEVEDFDNGGQGVAYNDADASNNGGAYRTGEGVDIEARDGGYTIGWTSNGEWLEYTVNTSLGTYDIEMRLAAITSGKVVNVLLDGATIASVNVPNTGAWGTFQTVVVSNIAVSAGSNRILRLEFEGGSTNINWVKFTAVSSPGTIITVQAESFTNTGGTYDDASAGGPGYGVYNAGTKINYVNNGDWADYNVNIPEDGAYEVVYYISSPNTGTTVSIGSASQVWNTTTVPNNGAWDSYQALTASGTVNLSAGSQVVRLSAGVATWTWNLDKFTLQRTGAMKNAPEELTANFNVTAYPNPSEGMLNITCNSDSYNMNIYSSMGTIVYSEQSLSGNAVVDLQYLTPGFYFISIESEEGNALNRIMIK